MFPTKCSRDFTLYPLKRVSSFYMSSPVLFIQSFLFMAQVSRVLFCRSLHHNYIRVPSCNPARACTHMHTLQSFGTSPIFLFWSHFCQSDFLLNLCTSLRDSFHQTTSTPVFTLTGDYREAQFSTTQLWGAEMSSSHCSWGALESVFMCHDFSFHRELLIALQEK